MSLRLDPTDPMHMSPEDRVDEAASIFARGVLRLHGRIVPGLLDDEIPPDSSPNELEPVDAARLDRVTGLTAGERR